MTTTGGTLTRTEADAHARHEQIIERGLATFVEVGTSLAAIREARTYRDTHATFADYCRERWGMGTTFAYDVIGSAAAASAIADTGMAPPANESQARALKAVPEPERAEVWRETLERTGGKPTAKAVSEVAATVRPTSVNNANRQSADDMVLEGVDRILIYATAVAESLDRIDTVTGSAADEAHKILKNIRSQVNIIGKRIKEKN